jgi:hypothetical protein
MLLQMMAKQTYGMADEFNKVTDLVVLPDTLRVSGDMDVSSCTVCWSIAQWEGGDPLAGGGESPFALRQAKTCRHTVGVKNRFWESEGAMQRCDEFQR